MHAESKSHKSIMKLFKEQKLTQQVVEWASYMLTLYF